MREQHPYFKVTRRRFLAGASLIAAAACAPAVTGPGATTQSGPKRGGVFIFPTEDPPEVAMAYLTTGSAIAGGAVRSQIFNTLLGYDMKMQFKPQLADKWSISADGKVYTFNLNPNVRFHDGKPMTSADVEFTARRYWADTTISPTLATIIRDYVEAIETPDAQTFVIRLKKPYAILMTRMAVGTGYILPKHIYDVPDLLKNPANDKPIGTGPFKLKEFVKGSNVELVRNDDYFKQGKPYLDRVVVQFVPDASSRVLAFEKGEVDMLHSYQIPFDKIADYRKDARFTVVNGGLGVGTVQMMLLNLDNQFLKKKDIRKAIAYALDREELNQKGLFGAGKKGQSNISSTNPWFEGKFGAYPTDVNKANQMLDAAGAPRGSDGKRFALRLDFASGIDYLVRWGEIIKTQLARVGIDVQIATADTAAFRDKMFVKRNFDMGIDNWVTGPDPGDRTSTRYRKANIGRVFNNAMGYDNPAMEKIMDDEVLSPTDEGRKAAWLKIQEILQDDLPVIPLIEMPEIQIHQSKFKDLITDGVFGYYSQPRDEAYTT